MKQSNQNLIVINGQTYDARSGMIVKNSTPQAVPTIPPKKVFRDIAPSRAKVQKPAAPNASLVKRSADGIVTTKASVDATKLAPRQHHVATAHAIHRMPQKAQTLQRNGLRRPQAAIRNQPRLGERAAQQNAREVRAQATNRPDAVKHFSPVTQQKQAATKTTEAPNKPSLALAQLQAQRANSQQAHLQQQQQAQATGSELKEQLIKARLEEAPNSREEKFQAQQTKLNSFFAKQPRLLTAVAGALGVLLLIGYVTYLNLPGISMRVAISRAGFAATMPGYKPSGYSINGPVAYSPGEVTLKFASNTNTDKFDLSQKQSGWDSQALLDNYVSKQTDNYLTYQEKGLTIYMYNGKASWVNGGVWYNIDGNANLSSDQILKIATSM